MNSKPRRVVLALTALVVIAVAGILVWLPFDPLESPAGSLDTLIPRNVDTAWRLDGASLVGSPFAQSAWNRPEAADLRERWDVEGRFLAPMRRMEAAFSDVSLGLADPPSIEGDLIPAEVVVATRGDDVLVATRISSRARAVEFLRKLPAARAEKLGIRIDGRFFVLDAGDGRALRVLRHRDVLIASTSAALMAEAAALADGGAGGLDGLPGWDDALGLARPAGSRVLGWLQPAAIAARLHAREEDPAGAEPPPWRAPLAALLSAKDAEPVRVELDLSATDALTASWKLRWKDGLPAVLEPLRAPESPEARSPTVSSLTSSARAYAAPDETIVAGGLTVSAVSVLRVLLASQPPERQGIFEDALAAAGESVDSIAKSLAAHFDDGVGFVVARVREADAVVRGDGAGLVHAIPATLVVFRLHGAGADRAVLAALNRRAETLFGQPLGDTVEVLGDGTRVHTLRRSGLAGQWELLRPAFSFRDGEFVFSTHEGFLRRALTAKLADRAPAADSAGRTLTLDVAAAPLRRWVDDQSWEAADRSTWRDWAAERRAIEGAIARDPRVRPGDRADAADARIRELKRLRREREIPAAAEAWRSRWDWLESLGDARLSVDIRGSEVEIRARLALAEGK